MNQTKHSDSVPCVLSIAGLDPSGGAGFLADVRGVGASHVHCCVANAVTTVQSTSGLVSVHPCSVDVLLAQINEVYKHQYIRAIKTGALGSLDNVLAVASWLRNHKDIPSIVDPVMVATRSTMGARLLDSKALSAMRELCNIATLVTPNRDEAEALLERSIQKEDDLIEAAKQMVSTIGTYSALVKGGHLTGSTTIDVLATQKATIVIQQKRIKTPDFHGGGCTLASLIAGRFVAKRLQATPSTKQLRKVTWWAKKRLSHAISKSVSIGDGLRILYV